MSEKTCANCIRFKDNSEYSTMLCEAVKTEDGHIMMAYRLSHVCEAESCKYYTSK